MAYNNPFPMGYQPMFYPPMPQNQQQQNNGIIWVQGEAGWKSFLVSPNTTVALWDSESPVIYLKSADASGMPSVKILDYSIRQEGGSLSEKPAAGIDAKDDLQYIKLAIDDIKTLIETLTPKRVKKEVKEDE